MRNRRMRHGALAAAIAIGMAAAPAPAQTSRPALSFELPMLDGSAFVRLADFSGQPVLLNFWGSECPPCIREMPLLLGESRRYPSVRFLGIAVDDRASASRFLRRQAAGYPQLVAPQAAEVLLRRFGNTTGGLPYTVVLNARHQMCASHLGEVDNSWIATAINACGIADNAAGSSNIPASSTGPTR